MKNKTTIILTILLLLSITLNVFFIFKDINGGKNPSKYCGQYFCNEWNGRQSTLIINKDGSGQYPGNNPMTWTYRDGQLIFTVGSGDEHIAIPTENGIILHDTPFFRM